MVQMQARRESHLSSIFHQRSRAPLVLRRKSNGDARVVGIAKRPAQAININI